MGVPRFAPWLKDRYPHLVLDACPRQVEGLYVDVNGVIHPFCHGPEADGLPESEKIENILGYLELLVRTAQPSSLLFLAVDGVAPRAKMNQQRARRYMSAATGDGSTLSAENSFDSNAISPGTEFMARVTAAMEKFIADKLTSDDHLWSSISVVLSDSNVPSEGEHKIIKFLRSQTGATTFLPRGHHVVVGLDADLVFLSLSLHIPSMVLMRDTSSQRQSHGPRRQFTSMDSIFEYFSIDAIGESLVSEIYHLSMSKGFAAKIPSSAYCHTVSSGYQYSVRCDKAVPSRYHPCLAPYNSKVIDDFIVLAIAVGNDFMSRLPSAYCGEAALDHVLECYASDVLPYGFVTSGSGELNEEMLSRFFESYAAVEKRLFLYGEDPDFWVEWSEKEKKYDELCRLYYASTKLESVLEEACRDYIHAISFVWSYYSRLEAVDWQWFYPHHYSPMAKDLHAYLKTHPFVRASSLVPEVNEPCDKFLQLLSILPPRSAALVPPVCRKLLEPTPENKHVAVSWDVDFTGALKEEEHLAAVLLPFADMRDLKKKFEEVKLQLSADEALLNRNQTHHKMYFRDEYKARFTMLRRVEGGQHLIANNDVVCEEFIFKPLEIFPRPRTYDVQQTPRQDCYKQRKVTSLHRIQLIDVALIFLIFALSCTLYVVGLRPARLFLPMMQIISLFVFAVFLMFFLEVAVRRSHKHKNVIKRQQSRRMFVNWVCCRCENCNFDRQSECFFCAAPFDPTRCAGFFTSRFPQDAENLWHADHRIYLRTYHSKV